jgi:hypothetical protein
MRTFAFECQDDGFMTGAIRAEGEPDQWSGVDDASHDIAMHVLTVHDGAEGVQFASVDVVA